MAEKSQADLLTDITTDLTPSSPTAGDVTAAEVRGVLSNMVDSAVNKTDETTAFGLSLLAAANAAAAQALVACPPTSRTITAGTGLTGVATFPPTVRSRCLLVRPVPPRAWAMIHGSVIRVRLPDRLVVI